MTLEPIDIAAALKFYQTKRGLTGKELAEKAGICPFAYGRSMKTGTLHLSTLSKLLTALNVDLYTFSLLIDISNRGTSNEAASSDHPLYIPHYKRERRKPRPVRG